MVTFQNVLLSPGNVFQGVYSAFPLCCPPIFFFFIFANPCILVSPTPVLSLVHIAPLYIVQRDLVALWKMEVAPPCPWNNRSNDCWVSISMSVSLRLCLRICQGSGSSLPPSPFTYQGKASVVPLLHVRCVVVGWRSLSRGLRSADDDGWTMAETGTNSGGPDAPSQVVPVGVH